MIIHVIKKGLGLTEITNVNPKEYKSWKKHFTKGKDKDKWLSATIPVLFDDEYINFINYTQDTLIDELLK